MSDISSKWSAIMSRIDIIGGPDADATTIVAPKNDAKPIRAAGIMFVAKGKTLLIRRASTGDHVGEWCFPGGRVEDGETVVQAAKREVAEETGFTAFEGAGDDWKPWTRRVSEGVDYTTFLARLDDEFTPVLNDEHDAFEWAPIDDTIDADAEDVLNRADDLNFVEQDHPRDASGKFTGGSTGHGVESYKKTLKPGSKGSAAALMKHMIEAGTYGKNDIADAAKKAYGVPQTSVNWYFNDIKKKTGLAAPQQSHAPTGNEQNTNALAPTASSVQAPPVAPVANAKKASKDKIDLSGLSDAEKVEKLKNTGYKYLPISASHILNETLEHFDKLTQTNKPAFEAKTIELFDVLTETKSKAELQDALSKIEPMEGLGMSANAINSVIQKTQAAHHVTPSSEAMAKFTAAPTSPAYTPSTPAQVKAFTKLKNVPHFRQDHINYFEDANGGEIKAVLKTNTKEIPGDHYALVTSSYAGSKGDGNTEEVGKAMEAYRQIANQKLSPEEQLAAQNYKGHYYTPINNYLLGNTSEANTPDYIKTYAANMKEAINKSVVPADTPSYRGLRCSLKDLSGFDDVESSIGRCFEHKNFASVSRDRNTSEDFAGKGGSHAKVLMKLTIPAGAKGLVLGNQRSGEQEIVLPDKCAFRIDSAEPWDHGKGHLIHVTYLGVRE